ncbi:SprT family protein [Cohnella abietis]|uniref:Protein SprT-like n=1 Tax=Cohnella abietis TaxID=2507935 RepID=A0A3T1D1B1_9BACL|nr:SprT family protein [Cohnella abietis]BBI31874.1 protein SprT [Cohnella abietis]
MEDQELQHWIERVSLTYFGRPFLHQASFNPRLRTTGGRYFTKSHNIEISPHQLAVNGPEETEAIIKHELCHYHLHLQKRGYQHRDADFKQLLVAVGATRHCKALPGVARRLPIKYLLVCQSCGMNYPRKRRTDPRKYACGRCKGKLKLFHAQVEPSDSAGSSS